MSELLDKRVPTADELFERVKNNKANVSKHPWKDWNISKEEWVEYIQGRIRQDIGAPNKGEIAPDFSVEKLDRDGKRTGEMFNLSSLFGVLSCVLSGLSKFLTYSGVNSVNELIDGFDV